MRASDQDRERVGERLRQAATEGRLLADELEQRLERLLRSRTYAELDELVSDLPGQRLTRRRSPRSVALRGVMLIVGLMLLAPLLTALATVAVAGLFSGWLVWTAVAAVFWGRTRGRHCRPGPSRAYRAYRAPGSYGSYGRYGR